MINRPAVLCFCVASLHAHDPITTKLTWSREISRIVYARCASCHQPDGTAPMALTSYQEARPWAKAIKEEVLNRRMPPWDAVKGFGRFHPDRGLSREEIQLIAEWVEGGAPEGDPQYTPPSSLPKNDANRTSSGVQRLEVKHALTLTRASVLVGVDPAGLVAGSEAQLIALRPDGHVEPLIWIRNFHPQWNLVYWFGAPMRLPPGTRIIASPAARLTLLTEKRRVPTPGRTPAR